MGHRNNDLLWHFPQVPSSLATSQMSTGISPALSYGQPQGAPDLESPVPVINLKDGTRLAGDDAPKRKDLEKWLKEHPGYVEDLGAFIPVGGTLKTLTYFSFTAGRPIMMKYVFLPPISNLCSA